MELAATDPLAVLHLDADYAIIDKPSGVVCHRVRGCADRPALQRLRDQLGAHVYAVHRLDRGTSGVLVFARHIEAARRLSECFAQGRVTKSYEAVVRGHPAARGTIDSPLRDESTGRCRAALTEFVTLRTTELPIAVGRYRTARYAWISLLPTTGRTHQLRRHLAHIRHPIVGDVRHGDGHHNRAFRQHFASRRLLLFARRLQFTHPFTARAIDVWAPLPPAVTALLGQLGLAASEPDGRARCGATHGFAPKPPRPTAGTK